MITSDFLFCFIIFVSLDYPILEASRVFPSKLTSTRSCTGGSFSSNSIEYFVEGLSSVELGSPCPDYYDKLMHRL